MSGFRSELAMLLVCGLLLQVSAEVLQVSAEPLRASAEPAQAKVSHARPIPTLNRVTFSGNVYDEMLRVEHWMVLFCVEWYEPCQRLRQSYVDLANDYERKLNADALLQLPVRFAEVDCTVDKVLCNEQFVDWYPEIVHYHRGEKIARWEFSQGKLDKEEEKMTRFLEAQMNFSAPASASSEGELLLGSAGGNRAEDVLDLPLAQQHPVKTAIRLAPLAAALVGMAAWVFTAGAEVLQNFRRLTTAGSDSSPSSAAAAAKPPLRQPAWASGAFSEQAAGQPPRPSEGLHHRLPQSWARERRSIEL